MNLIFSDSSSIDGITLKKLMLVGNNISFIDRPSISLAKNVGTVGVHSNIRGFEDQLTNEVVTIKTIEPPTSVFHSNFYRQYFQIDQNNAEFKKVVIGAILTGWFDYWLLDSTGKNNNVQGHKNLIEWISKNQQLILETDLSELQEADVENFFALETLEDALRAFRTMLWEFSLKTTAILHGCNIESASPISISPYYDQAIKIRISDSGYSGKKSNAKKLGLNIMEMFLSDQALEQIHFKEILSFRKETEQIYQNYIIEINKLEAELIRSGEEIDLLYLMDTKINPEINKLRNELLKARNLRFKKLLTILNNGVFSTIAAGTLSLVNLPAAVLGFVGGHLKSPKITQEIIEEHFKIKEIQNNSHLTYLLKLSKLEERKWTK
ncbi:hypothetical protein [Flavobacterium johnsoniae]|uniref:Uncharacterized protein n=1 Tax=Flavobacterium johnsoniae (strain ATCC 17061 / DSM 2064 / JCM 8514 / BCRC 14874 / CCUG 350202 / NBRC 14942 / NCIMB 11054 / UW101) TaxID=376686 RepID=A5FDV1_FLAJ1|nr:hypothetical protein [Flavobacterium johnsoniae]ABQ06619.1 hypothetical protein Fjoh_3605 [Flavobacterium johnsoniae UW101]OXE99856.1 hypothetical protein B0A63_11175 [Flavobacterium johnsoniae UW101]WQG82370.1 hypothetical protein SR927_04470 [Flavobacterium johnsoniae UW101]SHK81469.1 hypothetical protein SAMN05444146_2361 [Flavobacterium johnsoniae]